MISEHIKAEIHVIKFIVRNNEAVKLLIQNISMAECNTLNPLFYFPAHACGLPNLSSIVHFISIHLLNKGHLKTESQLQASTEG
jgi:hypothetical protein